MTALAFMVAAEQPERAGVILRRALGTNGEIVRRIRGFRRRDRHSIALSLAESLTLHSAGHADAPARACRIRLDSGDHAGARRMAEDLVRRFPSARPAWHMLTAVALETEDIATARMADARLAALLSDGPAPPTPDERLVDERLVRARLLARVGSIDEAMHQAGEAHRSAPDGAAAIETAICRARIARLHGDSRQAAAILSEILGTGPGDADLFAELGDALRECGDDREAASMARRALRIVPDHRPALRCLAHALNRSGAVGSSIDAFLHLLDIEPDDQDALYGVELAFDHGSVDMAPAVPPATAAERAMALWARGKRFRAQDRPREAAVLFEQALAAAPDLGGAAVDLGWTLLDLGWPDRAMAAFEAGRQAGDATGAEGIGEAAELQRALTEPLPPCKDPLDFDHLVEGCATALRMAGSAAIVDPVDVTAEAAQLVTSSATAASQRTLAERFARTALERSPDHPALRLLSASCLVNSERYTEAATVLDSLAAQGYAIGPVHYLRAICANASGDAAAAEAGLATATAMVAHLADFAGNLGDLRLQQGDVPGAVAAYREATRRMPSFATAHQNYAARYDHTLYAMTGLEADLPDDVLLADGFNRSGEKRLHVGDTAAANRLYGGAIMANRRLGRDFRLSDDLVEALGLPTGKVRILPQEWVTQIGHLAMLDTWLKIGALGWRPPAPGILLAPANLVANRAYLDCWRPFLTVVEDPVLIERLMPLQRYAGENFNGWIGDGGQVEAFTDVGARAYDAWSREGRAPLLHLSPDLAARGRAALVSAGMEPDAWFVAMHIRNSGFHAEGVGSSQDHRNADLAAYQPAIDMVTARGGWVIRLGDHSMPPLPEQARVIDYARSPLKSDWMDVFLCAAARCYLGTTSGLANVAISFNTPSVLVNCVSNYAQLWPSNVTFTWRPYWSDREGRYLSLEEILAEPVRGMTFSGNLLAAEGLIPRDNDAEDIRSALEERLDILAGQGRAEDSPAVRLWDDAAASSCYFGGARPARGFAERTRPLFFPGR
nr:TIGR04372 family glycosyltransferase [Azospirillum sp. 412522]